jgi:protein phosphatase-4 regulatory subunit 3
LEIVAALTVLSHTEPAQLSLQQHLELAPDLVAYNALAVEGDPEPLMMAQHVPHPATDKKRVKVYELRNNDWFDRGTGFCSAAYQTVWSLRAHVRSWRARPCALIRKIRSSANMGGIFP